MSARRMLALVAALAIAGSQALAQAKNAPAKAPAATAPAKAATQAPAKPVAAPAGNALIDINTATREQLMAAKGIGEAYADKIIKGRPFKSKDELWRKKIMPKGAYDKLKDQIIAKQ
ncbi:MAG: helix-hairpin-helix domain-containing protein [Gemmatimonadetes bacterium]|nr:helix-hairpin-helix domain-containing protein [Gemmatimonadota bacterium]